MKDLTNIAELFDRINHDLDELFYAMFGEEHNKYSLNTGKYGIIPNPVKQIKVEVQKIERHI